MNASLVKSNGPDDGDVDMVLEGRLEEVLDVDEAGMTEDKTIHIQTNLEPRINFFLQNT